MAECQTHVAVVVTSTASRSVTMQKSSSKICTGVKVVEAGDTLLLGRKQCVINQSTSVDADCSIMLASG